MTRYQAVEGSQQGHACCFDATVVDTQIVRRYADEKFEVVCECFDMGTAQRIATALDMLEQSERKATDVATPAGPNDPGVLGSSELSDTSSQPPGPLVQG